MLLQVNSLSCDFFSRDGVLRVLDGIQFELRAGETVGLVGESGGGKTMLGLSILDLVPPAGRIVQGQIFFEGTDILKLDEEAKRLLRGRQIGFVPQEPAASWNPVFTVGYQIAEVLREHLGMAKPESRQEAIRLLEEVGLREADRHYDAYPFQLSGGMQQRALIALAMCCRPKLLIADEPTTALDATLQLGILDLLQRIQKEHGTAILLISHDLGVVSRMASRTVVLYAGRIVESGPTETVLKCPQHPYTIGLKRSVPVRGLSSKAPLEAIPGAVPDLQKLPEGCSFHPRCTWAVESCSAAVPPLSQIAPGHWSACPRLSEIEELSRG